VIVKVIDQLRGRCFVKLLRHIAPFGVSYQDNRAVLSKTV